jgi:hypothetical protein
MARTLQQLKESIENLIEQQGKDAPVAAFIFTQEDVFEMDEECNSIPYPLEIAEVVLNEVEDLDYIYSQIFECIDDEVKRLQVRDVMSNQSQSE